MKNNIKKIQSIFKNEIIIKTTNVITWVVSLLGTLFFDYIWYIALFCGLLFLFVSFRYILRFTRRRKQRNYYTTIDNNKEFYNWHISVLEEIYSSRFLTNLFNVTFSSFYIKSANTKEFDICNPIDYSNYITNCKDFEQVLNGKSFTSNDNIKKLFPTKAHKRLRRKYAFLVSKSIRYPDLTGFMLDRYILNNKEELTNISCRLGTYYQNVMTSHILEYELYDLYRKMKKKQGKAYVPENILELLPYRYQIHQYCNNNPSEVIYSGGGRFSLLSVQIMIIYFDPEKQEYYTIVKKRASKNIAAKLGYFQILPAGGFELYEKEERCYNLDCIDASYLIKLAVYRELLEELFNIKRFEGVYDENENVHTSSVIYSNEYIQYIENLIKNGGAQLQILGSTVDTVSLRHNISCVLKVDDTNFKNDFLNHIRYNAEFDDNMGVMIPLKEFENKFKGNIMVTPDSVGLYALLKESELFKEISKQNNQ